MASNSVNINGSPAEQANSTKLTLIASPIIPKKANIKLFSDVNFFILEKIFFLFFESTISHPEFLLFIKLFKFSIAPIKAIIAIIFLI